MTFFLIAAVSALISTNPPGRLGEFIVERTGADAATNSRDAVEQAFQKLMQQDDDAQEEVDKWIKENEEFAAKGTGVPREQLRLRILQRLDPIGKAYEDFINAHPKHSRVRVAYASFLSDTKSEEAAMEQLENALAIDTNNPAIYNNLANIYGHRGPVTNAFTCYEKAISISPLEPVYYHNFGTTVYLFRKDAKEHYHLNEEQVFAKAFALYSNAMRLDPTNFPLASDVAQSYYGVNPLPTQDALKAWTNALSLARDQTEREGIYIHFARVNLLAGRYDLARAHLDAVTNTMYADLKRRILRNLEEQRNAVKSTNAPPANPAAAK